MDVEAPDRAARVAEGASRGFIQPNELKSIVDIEDLDDFGQVLKISQKSGTCFARKLIARRRMVFDVADLPIRTRQTHPNIVSVLNTQNWLQYIHMDMEYCELSLDEYVKGKKTGIHGLPDWSQAQTQGQRDFLLLAIIQQILSGLAAIHKSTVEHGCLTMSDVLYSSETGWWKIGNCGMRTFYSGVVSAAGYTAPENVGHPSRVPGDGFGKSDIWSFGCILFDLYYGLPLFADLDEVKQFAKLNRDIVIEPLNGQSGDGLFSWIKCILRIDYHLRPTAQQLGQRFHELLAVVTPSAEELPYDYLDSKYLLGTDIPPDSLTHGTFEGLRREDLFTFSSPKHRVKKRAEQVLDAREALLGSEHPLTIWSMNVLAWIYYFEGPLNKAMMLFEDLIAAGKRMQGPEHRETLASMAGLAWTMALDPRSPDQARGKFDEVRVLQEKVLGAKHPDTMNTTAAFGRAILLDGYGIMLLAAKLEKSWLSSKFADSPRLEIIEERQKATRRVQEGFDLLEETYRNQRSIIGNTHRDTAETLSYLAWAYLLKGKTKRAAQLQSDVFAVQKEALGISSPETLFTLSEWGWRLVELGRPEGIQKLQEAWERQKIVLGKSHFHTRSSLEGLKWAHKLYGQKRKAEQL